MNEKILTRHPQGKHGVRIDREKYRAIREAIEALLTEQPGLSFMKLAEAVDERLQGQFAGSVAWYTVSVKLDMEAEGVLERIAGSKPVGLRLVNRAKHG